MVHRFLILALVSLAGCGTSAEPQTISVGDNVSVATETLVSWGGVGHYMDVYTVTVPDDHHADSVDPDHYKVVDPATKPFDAYSFGSRGISLHHRDGVVTDIELITYGDSKLTTKHQDGIKKISRAELK